MFRARSILNASMVVSMLSKGSFSSPLTGIGGFATISPVSFTDSVEDYSINVVVTAQAVLAMIRNKSGRHRPPEA